MKENKGKKVVDEPHPSIGDKRKTLPKTLDLGNLPNRRGKKAKHRSSRPGLLSLVFPPLYRLSKFFMLTRPFPLKSLRPSAPTSSQPSQRIPMNPLENEDLAWERFEQAETGEDVTACYDISLKEFEHSGVHDLFKVITFTSSCLMYIYIYIYIFLTKLFNHLCKPCSNS